MARRKHIHSRVRVPHFAAIPHDHVLVIAAAVAELVGERARIVSIVPIEEKSAPPAASRWVVRGRQSIMRSHSIRSDRGRKWK